MKFDLSVYLDSFDINDPAVDVACIRGITRSTPSATR